MPWRGPEYAGELPTLGWWVLDWFEEYLVVPAGPSRGAQLILTNEQAQFILDLYTVDPAFTGPANQGRAMVNARRIRRAILSRPKGWGKSPLLAALCLVEMLGDVVLDGWDADGEPVGRPWTSLGFKAKTQVVATSEAQTKYCWEPLLEMAGGEDLVNEYDVMPMETFVAAPRARAEYSTSSATTQEGFTPVFAVLDQTESWTPTVGGPKLASAIRRNLGKTNGCSVEAPNAFVPGARSVAEASFKAARARTRSKNSGILLSHREAPPDTDPADPDSLRAGLAYAYGESADCNGGWVSMDRIVAEYWDPDTDPQDARLYYLNQVTHASDSWLSQPEVAAIAAPDTIVADREMITLGFDGSRKRDRGVTDATALIGCRVSDGHLFEIAIWEQPLGPEGEDWQVPVIEVLAAVDGAFERWNVVGMFADPAKWEGHVIDWEAKYGPRLKVKASHNHPIQWWMTGGRSITIVRATLRLHNAIVDREITYCGSHLLTKHLINARRRESAQGIQVAKPHPTSPDKIDGVTAAILATECRAEAVAKGLLKQTNLRGYTF